MSKAPTALDAQREADRLEALANNQQYQRLKAQDKANTRSNSQRTYDGYLQTLKVATPKRDESAPRRQRYEIAYTRLRDAARRLAESLGEPVAIPRYRPPVQVDDNEEFEFVGGAK